jgi:hypothetical protein
MSLERESYVLSDEQVTGMKQDVTTFDQKVDEFALNLKLEERHRAYKMGPRALPFVTEVKKCVDEYPDVAPSFLNVEKFKKDFTFSVQTADLAEELAPVVEKLTETSIVAGVEAFAAARAYYQALKAAAKANKPGADAVVARLEKFFYRKQVSKKAEQTATTPESPATEG